MKKPWVCLVSLVLSGCASPMVMLVAPAEGEPANCFEACEALFGLKPTVNCGVRKEPRRVLTCSYDHRYPAQVPAKGEAEVACREQCASAGLEKVEACWAVKTQSGEATVACRYQVPFH
ncbi:MAG: hypothetical protein QM765_26625 [Myxococcales bacterium]